MATVMCSIRFAVVRRGKRLRDAMWIVSVEPQPVAKVRRYVDRKGAILSVGQVAPQINSITHQENA